MEKFIAEVSRSAQDLRALFQETPLQRNEFLSQKYQADIFLKREDLTPVRSYKIRGAFHLISQMLQATAPNVPFVCASAGNHAQGVAFVCHHFKRQAIIFMPVTTPQQKIVKTQIFGGENVTIRLIGDTFDECYQNAQDFVAEGGGVMVPPFDHMGIIEGQATLMHELCAQWPLMGAGDEPDLIIIPIGGGGVASGVCRYVQAVGWSTQLRFAEPEGAASLFAALMQKRRVKLDDIDGFVDGAAVAQIGALNFDILKHFSPYDVIPVPQNRLCATMVEMLNLEGIVLEPAGALSIDALRSISPQDLKGKRVVLIVSGGNFDFERLPDVKERALRFQGLKKYFIFRFPQRPGALSSFLGCLGPDDDIARFEYLKKSARNFGSVLIAIETTDEKNFVVLEKKFEETGWAYRDITNDQALFDFVI